LQGVFPYGWPAIATGAVALSNIIRRKHSEASIQQFLEDMKALQEVSLALSQVDDLEQLYVQMITLTQTRMGIDQVGLFVLSEDGATLQGTFGVSPEGTLRDERNFHEAITPGHWTEEIIAAPNHTKLWLDAPLYDNSGVVGQGWKVAASLWNGHQSLGFLVCDALLSGRPPRPYEAELIAQLGSTLGHLIERKRADERLRESEARFRQIIENASDIIYRMDALGRTTYINPVGLNLIGYKNEAEALGKHFTEFVAPSWRSRVKAFYKKQAIEQKDNTYYEFLGITKTGREIWIGQNVQLIRSQDGIVGFQAVARDITELKNTQFALAEARDQALDASRFKSQLLSRVSHELRTPLGGVMGYAELLQQGAFGPLSAEQQDAATNIVASANYLNIMINELLDQAQIEARAMQIHIAPFEPERLLHSVESNMRILAQNKNLQLTTEFDPSLPPQLMGDERRLQQVIINLTGNAIKFTQQGEVRISLLRLNDAQWGIRVTDTGAGIPKEAQEYIFDPFRQVDNAITRHNRGTGLGLSITKQLVELMGGSIDLQSEVGRGSTFTIILPLHTPTGA
ncbi:MAG: ATP-binding protein, partial [Anaerolineales bacterium]